MLILIICGFDVASRCPRTSTRSFSLQRSRFHCCHSEETSVKTPHWMSVTLAVSCHRVTEPTLYIAFTAAGTRLLIKHTWKCSHFKYYQWIIATDYCALFAGGTWRHVAPAWPVPSAARSSSLRCPWEIRTSVTLFWMIRSLRPLTCSQRAVSAATSLPPLARTGIGQTVNLSGRWAYTVVCVYSTHFLEGRAVHREFWRAGWMTPNCVWL